MYSLLGCGFRQWGFSLLHACPTSPVLTVWWLTANKNSVGCSGSLLLVLASTVIPGSWSCGPHDHIFLSHGSGNHAATHSSYWSVSWVNFCWPSPTHSLILGPIDTHDNIFVLSKIFVCFEIGPPLQLEGGWLRLCWAQLCLVNRCWPSTAQSFLVLGPMRLIAIFYCLMTLFSYSYSFICIHICHWYRTLKI
jgi:hypothetical protein